MIQQSAGAALFNFELKLLLIKRAATKLSFPNTWACPSGRQETEEETLEATAIREVKEEVGLDFIPEKKLGTYQTQLSDRITFGTIYLGTWTGEITLKKEECSEYGWFTYEEAIQLEFGFQYRQVVEDLHTQGYF